MCYDSYFEKELGPVFLDRRAWKGWKTTENPCIIICPGDHGQWLKVLSLSFPICKMELNSLFIWFIMRIL